MLPRARLVSLGWETKTGNRHIQVTSFKNTHILKVNRLEENLKSAIELLIMASSAVVLAGRDASYDRCSKK